MKAFLLVLFITFFIIAFITYPFKIKGVFHIDVYNNVGFIAFKVLFIKLAAVRFKLADNGQIKVHKLKKKKKKDNYLFTFYVLSLAQKVNVKKLELFFDFGNEDPYFASLVSGYMGAITSSIISVFLNRYEGVKIFTSFIPKFDKNQLEASGEFVVTFSLIDVLLSFINALSKYINHKKEKRNV